jgi:hypothetical protein
VRNRSRHLAPALGLNYSEFPDSCRQVHFALVHDVLNVFADRANVFLEQLGHLPLGQPDGVALPPNGDAALPVLGLV